MDNYLHLPFILSFPFISLLQDTRKYSPTFENPFSNCLAALFRLNNPKNNSSHLSGIRSSPVDHMSHKILRMQFNLPKILCSLWLLKFLSACIMVYSKCLALFIDILCHYHFETIDSIWCGCSQSSVAIRIHPSGSDVIFEHELVLDQSICRRLYPKPTQLIHP